MRPLPETSAFDFRLHNPNHDFTRDSSLNIVCCHKSYVSLTPTSGEVVDPPPIQSLGVPPVQSALSVATLERPQEHQLHQQLAESDVGFPAWRIKSWKNSRYLGGTLPFGFWVILLMLQKSQTTTWPCIHKTLYINNGIFTYHINW